MASSSVLPDNVQRHNVGYFVDEFECELENMSGRCISIGAGTGEITKDILLPALKRDAVMTGTDASKSMVEYANRFHSVDGVLNFKTFDIETSELPEKYVAEFDHVFSFPALHFCTDVRRGLENIYRMLRPGGTFLMLWISSHNIFKVLEDMAEYKCFASYLYKYTAPFPDSKMPQVELKELLRSIGFQVRHCSNREMSLVGKKPSDFLSTVMSSFPFLHEMPAGGAKYFKQEFIHEYMKKSEVLQKRELTVDLYKVLMVHAEKRVL
ncbi:PREDICTED: uncharacterized protein LOC105561194 [Vollenhovia emeryi]|uniref:uncharacterized protein LOC105561194 n=1 Tax=Vollenhovia emeryi TaxID=411798 RepID=UPI0005F40E12|nr:PREDICTED: uncharacterized protein LOC105561194 [Vollenhovia emeryi]